MSKDQNKGILLGFLGNDPGISWQGKNISIDSDGQAKHLVLNKIVTDALAEKKAVFVIEQDMSLIKICQLLNGEILNLSEANAAVALNQFVSLSKMFAVFEFEGLTTDQTFIAKAVEYILMQIAMQFVSGERSGRFLIVISEDSMIEEIRLRKSYFKELDGLLKKYGGSLIVCFQNTPGFDEKYGQDFQIIFKQSDNNQKK